MYNSNRGDLTMIFDNSKPIDEDTTFIIPQQQYHTKQFQGDHIGADMEKFFRTLYDQDGDFHIINLSVINNTQVLLVYAVPF